LACQQNWEFRLTFFAALLSPNRQPDVNNLHSYVNMFYDISEMVTKNLLKFYPTQEKKDIYFEEMRLLINICEEIITKIENYQRISYIRGQVLTSKFLYQNLSFDYARDTINYNSYYSALQNIQSFARNPNDMTLPPQDLINSCTQFIIYSYIISEKNCSRIFEYSRMEHLQHLAIFFIKKEIRAEDNYHQRFSRSPESRIKDLVSLFSGDVTGKIRLFVGEVLTELPELLEQYNFDRNIKSFTQLGKLQHFEPFKGSPYSLWNLKTMMALEKYLASHSNSDLDVD
jgi:hypothetical protein